MTENAELAAQISGWLTPAQALNVLEPLDLQYSTAIVAVSERLANGLITSATEVLIQEVRGRISETHFALLSKQFWQSVQKETHPTNLSFWDTGDLNITIDRHGHEPRRVKCFGLRFDPVGVRKLLPNRPPPTPPAPITEEPQSKGTPVSQAALEAWHAAYTLAYQGSEDTLAKAYASAEGMFPGKFVSRQRIRDLFKDRKPGRKPK